MLSGSSAQSHVSRSSAMPSPELLMNVARSLMHQIAPPVVCKAPCLKDESTGVRTRCLTGVRLRCPQGTKASGRRVSGTLCPIANGASRRVRSDCTDRPSAVCRRHRCDLMRMVDRPLTPAGHDEGSKELVGQAY